MYKENFAESQYKPCVTTVRINLQVTDKSFVTCLLHDKVAADMVHSNGFLKWRLLEFHQDYSSPSSRVTAIVRPWLPSQGQDSFAARCDYVTKFALYE